MNKGAHTSLDGLQQIINIKASLNLGISEIVKSEFEVKPVKRPEIQTTTIPDPNWVSGFVSGEGKFDAGIRTSSYSQIKNIKDISLSSDTYLNKSGEIRRGRVYLRFRLTQHERDIGLMELIIKYLGAGRLEKDYRKPIVYLVLGNFLELRKVIIPFFNKYPILGKKSLDYQDWYKIADLMTLESHLTDEGFEEIIKIESRMNRGRTK